MKTGIVLMMLRSRYNKDAVTELQSRGVLGAKTFHSLGLALWKGLYPTAEVQATKIRDILKEQYPRALSQPKKQQFSGAVLGLIQHVLKLVSLAKAYGLNPETQEFDSRLDDIISKHGVSDKLQYQLKGKAVAGPLQKICRMVKVALRESIATANTKIDYNDMIYMPLLQGLVTACQSKFVIVDECQDLDRSRSMMVEKLTGTGHLLAVGDLNQSVYGYVGAGKDVLEAMQCRMGGNFQKLPLTVSWRLPQLHVRNAVEFMHSMGRSEFTLEAKDGAVEGLIVHCGASFAAYPLDPRGNQVIICRTNAPLMRLALILVAKNIPCHMAGRKELAGVLSKLLKSTKATTMRELREKLDQIVNESQTDCAMGFESDGEEEHDCEGIAEAEAAAATKRDRIDLAMALLDMIDVVTDQNEQASLTDLQERISEFRSGDMDDSRPAAQVVKLMTIHKAKGLEFQRVYLLHPQDMPMRTTMRYGEQWEKDAEINAAFVAMTRSLNDLMCLRNLEKDEDLSTLWAKVEDSGHPTGAEAEAEGDSLPSPSPYLNAEIVGAFGEIKLQPPNGSNIAELRGSPQARSVLRDAVRRAYRARAKQVHPDKVDAQHSQDATAAFQALNEANARLNRWFDQACG